MDSKQLLLLAIAVLVGGVVPVQATVNSRLGGMLGTDFPQKVSATTISFAGGMAGVLVLLAIAVIASGGGLKLNTPLRDIPPLFFTGGLYGVVFVTASIMLVPRLGVAATVGAMLCGQMLMSVLFDQIGFLGTPQFTANPTRLLGLGLMLVGIVLVSNKAPADRPAATETEPEAVTSVESAPPLIEAPTTHQTS